MKPILGIHIDGQSISVIGFYQRTFSSTIEIIVAPEEFDKVAKPVAHNIETFGSEGDRKKSFRLLVDAPGSGEIKEVLLVASIDLPPGRACAGCKELCFNDEIPYVSHDEAAGSPFSASYGGYFCVECRRQMPILVAKMIVEGK